jgi:hypothetical protein
MRTTHERGFRPHFIKYARLVLLAVKKGLRLHTDIEGWLEGAVLSRLENLHLRSHLRVKSTYLYSQSFTGSLAGDITILFAVPPS